MPCLPGHTIDQAMPARPYHIQCQVHQAIPYTCTKLARSYHTPCHVSQAMSKTMPWSYHITYHMPYRQAKPYTMLCLPDHVIYHAMPARPYHIPWYACQTIPYSFPYPTGHTIYHMQCPPSFRIYHAMPIVLYCIPCHAARPCIDRPCIIPCQNCQTIPYTMHCQALHYTILCLARPYPMPFYARQVIPFTLPCPYHTIPCNARQAIPCIVRIYHIL